MKSDRASKEPIGSAIEIGPSIRFIAHPQLSYAGALIFFMIREAQ